MNQLNSDSQPAEAANQQPLSSPARLQAIANEQPETVLGVLDFWLTRESR